MDSESNGEQDDTLGGRIVHARESQELTTSQLARRIGVKTSTMHAWETDRSEPRPNRLLTLAGLLNVSPTWLLTGVGTSPVDTLTESEMQHILESIQRLRERATRLASDLESLEERLGYYASYES